jgi:hypothetical protein
MAFDQEVIDAWGLFKVHTQKSLALLHLDVGVLSFAQCVGKTTPLYYWEQSICRGFCGMAGAFEAYKSERYPVVLACSHCGALHQNGQYIYSGARWVNRKSISHAIVNAPFKIPIAQYAGDPVLDEVIAPSLDYEARVKQLGLIID